MRQLTIAVLLVSGLVGFAPTSAQATQVSIEVRHTPMLVRPKDFPSLCGILAFSLTEHLWIGAGYELIQDYDAILWKSEYEGHKPIAMSGIRAGAWYRGGATRHGMSWAAGGLLTYANPGVTFGGPSPQGLGRDTYVVDFGADLSIGHVWRFVRLEGFATPAWSYGRIVSPAIGTEERYSAFTYRIGGALAFLLGS